MKRSKLLMALALFYLLIGGLSLFGLVEASDRDSLYFFQAILAVALELALAIGLFLQRSWSIPLFVAGALALTVLNWFWLRAHPPADMFWGTKWLIAVIFNFFPGALMFLRRNTLRSRNSSPEIEATNA